MSTHDDSFNAARGRVRAALAEMGTGQPDPYIDCWPESDDVTLFGAWGPIERGKRRLDATFRWVGSRFQGGPLVPEDVVAFASGDLAYTVGFEHGEVVIDGGARQPMTIRVTHIYRRIAGAWRLVHRHADFPPPDPRAAAHPGAGAGPRS
jgi:ketosteroid isomerase-like protein